MFSYDQLRQHQTYPYWFFLVTDLFNNMVDRTDHCALSNPWSSLFKKKFSVLAFFITSWDNVFFLPLLLFFFLCLRFSCQAKFKKKIWFQNQRRVTINNMSNSRNNKQLWSTWHKFKEKTDFKSKKSLVCINRIATQSDHAHL